MKKLEYFNRFNWFAIFITLFKSNFDDVDILLMDIWLVAWYGLGLGFGNVKFIRVNELMPFRKR